MKITYEFLKLGNNNFIAFIKTLLNQVIAALFFSADLKKRATELQDNVNQLHTMATSNAANKAELAQVQRAKLSEDIKDLLSKMESELRAMPISAEDRLALVHGLGLNTRKQPRIGARSLKARAGETKGSVILTTRGQADSFDWWYSKDTINFTNPVRLESTGVAKRDVHELEHGLYAFFTKAHRKNEESVEEGPVLFAVK